MNSRVPSPRQRWKHTKMMEMLSPSSSSCSCSSCLACCLASFFHAGADTSVRVSEPFRHLKLSLKTIRSHVPKRKQPQRIWLHRRCLMATMRIRHSWPCMTQMHSLRSGPTLSLHQAITTCTASHQVVRGHETFHTERAANTALQLTRTATSAKSDVVTHLSTVCQEMKRWIFRVSERLSLKFHSELQLRRLAIVTTSTHDARTSVKKIMGLEGCTHRASIVFALALEETMVETDSRQR